MPEMFLLTACALLSCASAFNLDVDHATVFVDPEGQEGSYFGFTVSLLKESGQEGGSWLLIGAPRGNSTYLQHTSIKQPGVIYQCKLGDENEECKPLLLESKGESIVYEQGGYSYHDNKNNSFLGMALEVQDTGDGRIAVCGPKWKNQFYGLQPMNGVCYWLNGSKNFEADAGKLIPLLQRSKQGIKFKERYGYKRDPNEVFYYIYGGAGMSISFVQNSTEMLIGAPGVFDWMGTIIRYRDSADKIFDIDSSGVYSKSFVPNPFSTKQFTAYSYFGYSVGSGKFLHSSRPLYVGGAPRAANLKGMVFIFDFPEDEEESLEIKIEIRGYQMGEYFGSSLCVIDLNSDGLDDLVVGAPQHSLETSNTLTDLGDEGRIYVFINNGNGNLNEIGDKHKITGSQQGARFGTAVSNVGDLNNDGYPDIAVGAPYENFGRGAVYIYHGQFDGIKSKFAQKILAQDIDNHIYGFGFSISRGSDSDGNNCLDVAVGAYDSGHVVLFRSLPVIKFYANLATNVRRINFDDTEFRAKACISYVGKYAPDSIEAEITLKADPTYGRAVLILDSKNISLYVYKVKLKYGMEQCKEFGVEIIGSHLDFSKPIEVLMQYNLTNSSQSGTDRRRNENGFCKNCPILDPSIPSYVIHKVPYATGCKDDICKTDIKNYVSFVDFRSSSYVIGSSDSIQLKVSLKNTGDPAFLSYANITFPSITPLIRVPKNCKEISIASNISDINGLQCEMGNPLASYTTKELILHFDTKNIPTNSDQITFNISSGSTGEELEMDDNIKEVILPLRAVSDISIAGRSSQDHFYLVKKNETFSDKAISFSHSYEIHNLGPSPVQKVNASFSIPYRITTPSGIVTLTKLYKPQIKIDSESSELFDCSGRDFSFFMDQKIGYESNFSIKYDITSERREIILEEKKIRRRKREISSLSSIDEEKTVFINCSTVGVECVTVDCNLGPFKPTQTRANIILPFKVYPKDLESFLGYKNLILVSSTGSFEILDVPKPTKYDDKLMDRVHVYTFLEKLPESKIASWIIALAIIGGLLILLLLILGLIKLGFFKRDKKEEMEKLKHKSEMEESLTANMSD